MNCLKLCLVTHQQEQPWSAYQDMILKAIEGGVTMIQLREKTKSTSDIHQLAHALNTFLTPFNIPLVINDHVDIAQAVGAQGVHLGQGDLSPWEARQILGEGKIIGWSVETLEDVEKSNQMRCLDYIAASAVFPSKTKTDCKTIWGLEGLLEITRRAQHPVMGIGGIHAGNAARVRENGVCGVAVISAIHEAPCPQEAASALIQAIQLGAQTCLNK